MDVDLRDATNWRKLCISSTSYQEIKNRLGFKGRITLEQFNEIEKVDEDIKSRCGQVTTYTVNRYWEYMRKEKDE